MMTKVKSKRDPRKSGDECCVRNPDGSYTDSRLHEQMTEGVDDRHIRARTRATLLENGSPRSALNGLFPDLDPLPVNLSEERERVHRTKVRAEMREGSGISAKNLNRRFPDLEPLPED
jgi:hypothetical protein